MGEVEEGEEVGAGLRLVIGLVHESLERGESTITDELQIT